VKVVDGEGRVVPFGVAGELCARGYMTMKGYWGDPEKTAEVLTDSGWFHTGDVFVMEESGWVKTAINQTKTKKSHVNSEVFIPLRPY